MTTHLGKVKAITNAIIWGPRVPQEHSVRLWTKSPLLKGSFLVHCYSFVLDFWALLSGNSKSCKRVSKQELKLCNLIWNLIFNSFLSRWPFVQQISKRNSGGGEQCHLMCGYRFVLSHINFNFDVIIIRSERKTLKMKLFAFKNLFNVNKKLSLI